MKSKRDRRKVRARAHLTFLQMWGGLYARHGADKPRRREYVRQANPRTDAVARVENFHGAMKVALVGVVGVPLGKHKVKDPRMDQADKLVEADKKTYASVDVVGEDEALTADAIVASP